MALIEIPINEMNAFDLPKVCVITGSAEGIVFKPVKFAWYPRWLAVLAVSPLIFIIVALILTKRAKGELPFTEEAHQRYKTAQLALTLSILWVILAFAAGAVAFGSDVPAVGLGLWALALIEPIVVGITVIRGRRVLPAKITNTHVSLKIPSEQAAFAIREHLHAGASAPKPIAAAAG